LLIFFLAQDAAYTLTLDAANTIKRGFVLDAAGKEVTVLNGEVKGILSARKCAPTFNIYLKVFFSHSPIFLIISDVTTYIQTYTEFLVQEKYCDVL